MSVPKSAGQFSDKRPNRREIRDAESLSRRESVPILFFLGVLGRDSHRIYGRTLGSRTDSTKTGGEERGQLRCVKQDAKLRRRVVLPAEPRQSKGVSVSFMRTRSKQLSSGGKEAGKTFR